jgi:hypothetical protein
VHGTEDNIIIEIYLSSEFLCKKNGVKIMFVAGGGGRAGDHGLLFAG